MFRLARLWALFVPAFCWGASSPPLHFEPNLGQASRRVLYIARSHGDTLFIQDHAILLEHSAPDGSEAHTELKLEGSASNTGWQALEQSAGKTFYTIGNRPERWIRDVPQFDRLARNGVYPGIDLVLHGSEGRLEYDFVVAPGADPRRIHFCFSGQQQLSLDPAGDLIITLKSGQLIQKKPILYQTNPDGSIQPVTGAFRLLGRKIGRASCRERV